MPRLHPRLTGPLLPALLGLALLLPATHTHAIEFDVSLTLEGIFHKRFDGREREPAGFGHDHDDDHGHHHDHDHDHSLKNGFNAGHSELGLRARTDWLDAWVMVGFDDKHVDIEEAYLATRALPAGLRLKAGKFLSDIGYINNRHPHDWDFVQRPLVNEYLIGHHGLLDKGVQLSITPPTAHYTHFGVELLRGSGEGPDRYDRGGYFRKKAMPRLITAYAKYGPELGNNHALQLGASVAHARQYTRVDDHGDHKHSVEGDSWLFGLDAVYRYEAGRAYGQGDWRIGGEYYVVRRDLRARGYSRTQGWRVNPARFRERQDGFYLEAVYGFAPRWQVGARAEAIGLNNRIVKFHPTTVGGEDASWRYSLQTTWRPRETVFVRGQLNHERFAAARAHGHGHGGDARRKGSWSFMLQLNALFGSHPAHRF